MPYKDPEKQAEYLREYRTEYMREYRAKLREKKEKAKTDFPFVLRDAIKTVGLTDEELSTVVSMERTDKYVEAVKFLRNLLQEKLKTEYSYSVENKLSSGQIRSLNAILRHIDPFVLPKMFAKIVFSF
jgi:hypothetical protein